MINALALEITDDGQSEIAAVLAGLKSTFALTKVAFGDGFGAFSSAQKTLKSQKMQAAISSSTVSADNKVLTVRAVASTAAPVWIREIGIFSGDKLVAYRVSPTQDQPLAYLGAGEEFIFTHELHLSTLNVNQITVLVDPNASSLESLIRLHEQSHNPHGITEVLATMLAAQALTNRLILANHYLDPLPTASA
jgi:phage-related tail fiber protein